MASASKKFLIFLGQLHADGRPVDAPHPFDRDPKLRESRALIPKSN
jgi:hypothetical protein